jgi:amino acid transporter
MYNWWKFVHIAGAFAFLTAHGVSVFVSFRVRKERDRDKIRELLTLSGATVLWMYVSLAVLVGAGVIGGFQGHWWGQRWIWYAIGVLVVTIGVMGGVARPYYQGIKEATTMRPSGAPRVSDDDLAKRLQSARPLWIMAVGFGGLLAILWLMVFKPS